MELEGYLSRIGFKGAPRADIKTLRALHRAHAETIPYENLDVQLRTPVTRAAPDIYDKIVRRGRGGWCYEMNGLLSWALTEIGFDVRRLAGAVHRETMGDSSIGNHLVVLVDVEDQTWLADVGFGDGLIEPTPLAESGFDVGPLRCSLSRIQDGWWRYSNDPAGGAPSFDFHPDVDDEALLEGGCNFLQSDPASPFVQNAVVQRWRDGAHYSMRGRVLTKLTRVGKEGELIPDAPAYVEALRDVFGLNLPEAAALWPRILARHEEVVQSQTEGGN